MRAFGLDFDTELGESGVLVRDFPLRVQAVFSQPKGSLVSATESAALLLLLLGEAPMFDLVPVGHCAEFAGSLVEHLRLQHNQEGDDVLSQLETLLLKSSYFPHNRQEVYGNLFAIAHTYYTVWSD